MSVFCTFRSMSRQRLCGGCAGSGLKLSSVFMSVLCTYVVVGLDRVLFVTIFSLVLTVVTRLSLVGAVSPSIFRTVPKCFVYGGGSSGFGGADVLRVCVFIVVSTGHCRS